MMKRSARAGWIAQPVAAAVLRYGLALVSVAAAFLLAQAFVLFHLPQPFTAFALSAIAITFWWGGIGPGIVAVLLSLLLRTSVFEAEVDVLSRAFYALAFVVFAVLMTVVARRRHELEAAVAERTAALIAANQELKLEIAERRQAQYLAGQVFESSPDAIFIAGRDYRCLRVNPVYERTWGMPTERIVGRHVADVLGSDIFEQQIRPNLDRCFAGEEVAQADWFATALGRRYLAVSYSPLRPDAARLEAALVISRDLTDHVVASETLQQARADLAHINRVTTIGELTASLAHEISQPITAAATNANACVRWLSRQTPNVDEALDAAKSSVSEAHRAAEIISRTRQLFKKGAPQRELVDVNEVIADIVALLRDEAGRYGVSIRNELATDLPDAMGDRIQLQQVLMNLMVNGIDAMKDVDGTRALTLATRRDDGGRLLVSVSDTGVGLPPDVDRIFEAFVTTKPHGTGMGLAISRSIVESHGGRLWATSNGGRGAVFAFTLPARRPGTATRPAEASTPAPRG